MISKQSAIHFTVLLVLAVSTGWFLVHQARKTEDSLDKIGFVSVQNTKKAGEDIDVLDTSKWKTYRNEEYGFELEYPLDYTVVAQPGSSKMLGRFFLIKNSDYAKLKGDYLFRTNPLLSLIENGSTMNFEIVWNGNEWVSQAFSSKNREDALKDMIVGANDSITHMGETYEKSLITFKKVAGFTEKEIYYYELSTKKLGSNGNGYVEGCFAGKEKSLFVEICPIIQSDSNPHQLMLTVITSFKNL